MSRPNVRPVSERRVLGLIRVSLERDGTTSPENQRHAIETYARNRGDIIVDWIEGIDESGSQRKSAWWARLDEAVTRMERGEVDAIVVWQFSRTARNRLKWAVALDRVDVAGGSLESATEHTDPSPSGRFTRGMLGEMSAYQAELIGATWRETHERRRRQGLPPTGGPRFGYIAHEGRYEPDPELAPVVADLYRRFLSGQGSGQLTRYLNQAGILRGERPWTYQGIMNALDSGFAAGLLGRTRPRLLPVWEREYSEGAHEPIIDRETWEAYVAMRASRTRRPARTGDVYMLTGLVRCGDCGGPMHGKMMDGHRHYTCSRASVTTGKRRVTIRAHFAEAVVEEFVLGLATDIDRVAEAEDAARAKRTRATFNVRSLERRIARAEDRLTALTVKLADGTINDTAYKLAAERIEQDRDEATRALRLAAPNPVRETAPARLPAELAALWPTMTPALKADVIRPLLAHVVIEPAAGRRDGRSRVRVVPAWEE